MGSIEGCNQDIATYSKREVTALLNMDEFHVIYLLEVITCGAVSTAKIVRDRKYAVEPSEGEYLSTSCVHQYYRVSTCLFSTSLFVLDYLPRFFYYTWARALCMKRRRERCSGVMIVRAVIWY
jgi:hypothetical protein